MDNKTYAQSYTITANAQTRVLDTRELNTILFLMNGTYVLTVVFEGSMDGTTWYPLQVASVNAATIASSHSTTNGTAAYEASVHAFSQVRVRCSAFTSGQMNLVIAGTSRAIEPAPVVQVANIPQVAATGNASPGTTSTSVNSAASTNAANVKSTAGVVYFVTAMNNSAAPKFVRLYNATTAPTVGTTVPHLILSIPAGESRQFDLGQVGLRFGTGIGYAITGAAGTLDATAVAAGDVLLTFTWM